MRYAILTCAIVAAAISLMAAPASAQLLRELPPGAEGVGVEPRTGEFLPTDLPFRDDTGRTVRLRDYLSQAQPLILSFNYSNCPQLCEVQLQNLVLALRDINLRPGRDYRLVSVSINPREQAARASESKAQYVTLYGQAHAAEGFHFLVGQESNIRALADAAGVQYKYIRERREYSHPPVCVLVAPDGRIVRYVYGVDFRQEQTSKLRMAIIEAAEGRVGSPINRLVFVCFVFDEHSGRYTLATMRIMQVAGFITVAALLIGLVPYWFRRVRSATRSADGGQPVSSADSGVSTENVSRQMTSIESTRDTSPQ